MSKQDGLPIPAALDPLNAQCPYCRMIMRIERHTGIGYLVSHPVRDDWACENWGWVMFCPNNAALFLVQEFDNGTATYYRLEPVA